METEPLLQLPFDLVEAVLLLRLATLWRDDRALTYFARSRIARLTQHENDNEQRLSAAKYRLLDQVFACLCVIIPSHAMCACAARLPAFHLESACKKGHIARLDKLHQLGLCIDPIGRALEVAIVHNHVSVLEWWIAHAVPISDVVHVSMAFEFGAFDTPKWIAKHRISKVRFLTLEALQLAILHDRADVVHAWLDWKDAKLVGSFQTVLESASKKGCVDILERIRYEQQTRFLEAIQQVTVLERVLADACAQGNVDVLQWWITVALALGMAVRIERVASRCAQIASDAGQVDVLRVWREAMEAVVGPTESLTVSMS
ncbi:hypothetical protein BCR44DRAFT_1435925 [Catenaria anguillulae PL171]|uniref:Uncharacterized protein n=1 Tax=Catenaria anguillulae PL171 TaxID=765915 RepID=A0A1Y2HIY5_9FUNG|nr:hypothetical protein BCR44DRAFT_1435925 [Catenaria anguillulae PL171]